MKIAHLALLVGALALTIPHAGFAVAEAAEVKAPPRIDFNREGFAVIAQERGVTVYQNETADMIWLGAASVIPASPSAVQSALLDYERQVGKIGRLSEVKVLERRDNHLSVYQRLNLPVVSDRDYVLRVEHGVEPSRHWIAYWAVTDQGPSPRAGIVRVTRHRGVWELVPVKDGKATLLRYEMRIDMGGSVPLWMVKSSAGDEIPELYGSICRLSASAREQAFCP
jgi:hypothetical protein